MLEADPDRFNGSLSGKRVVVGVSASISIYRVPDIIRDLRREGAEVIVGMSREAAEMINPSVFQWASGNEVVSRISGNIEHITLFENRETILLVCPASYNFTGKASNGISDDVPSLFFSFALGHGNPVIVSPVMHEGMMVNPINRKNLERLEEVGVTIIPPRVEAEKAKISESENIVDFVSRKAGKGLLSSRKILIIGGRGEEKIDPVRKITNSGTGFTARWLMKNAFRLGSDEIFFVGNSLWPIPDYVKHREAHTFEEFREETEYLLRTVNFDAVINAASLPDFKVENKSDEKIGSSSSLELHLTPVEKLNRIIREHYEGTLVVFKLEQKFDEEKTRKNFSGMDPDVVVFNPYSGNVPFGEVENDYIFMQKSGVVQMKGLTKPQMTLELLKTLRDITN